ncbi:MAG: hypothetical protein RLZZ08_946 [Pseudomonadota bacterium]
MPGRGDAYEKYLAAFDHWHACGWHVTAADWRGQAGSGRLGDDALTGHVDDFAVWLQDLAAFWRDWAVQRQQQQGPLVLAGHSMGGHLVLRAVAEGWLTPAPDAVVLSAPMLDVPPEAVPVSAKLAFAWLRCRMGDPRRPAWASSEKPGAVPAGRQRLLTHDDAAYADELWWRSARPELAMGPASWGWVVAALASIRRLRRADVLARVTMPVLVLATSADRLVGTRAIRRALRLLPRAQGLWFGPEAAHEILREVPQVRARALDAVDRFLDRVS